MSWIVSEMIDEAGMQRVEAHYGNRLGGLLHITGKKLELKLEEQVMAEADYGNRAGMDF